MDADVDGVATLVDDFDHLLVLSFLPLAPRSRPFLNGHTYQSAKLTDAVIHVHHVVAHLELLYLLEREGYLTAAGLVALEIVLMEAVENLVVGKQTETGVDIDEALVEGLVYGDEIDALLHLGEDVLQAFLLLGAVGEDIEFETL